MNWESFYFVCFLIGFFFSLLSFLAGSSHLHLHLPRGWHGSLARGPAGGKGSQNSPINFGTIAAFLAWFGGTGYLLTRYSSVWALLALALAIVSGLGGAAAVFWFLFKFLLAHEQDLDPADYDIIGVLGRVSSTVRENGTGEMIFSQNGVRRPASIRSENGHFIAKGVEVVVTRYEKGIAYVRPWEELSETEPGASSEHKEN
jgi:membrane protein implicated in regulation of membrane protease activity